MSENRESQAGTEPEAIEATDPVAIAIALGSAKAAHAAELNAAAAAFLIDQRRLVILQSEHLHEQRALQLSHLRVRRWKDRFSLSLQLLAFVVGTFAGIGLLSMAWNAHENSGLFINAFSVPPDLAADGLSGAVIAQRFIDRLNALRSATESDRPSATFQNNWGDDIKLEIPETGLKLGELEKVLRDRLGNVSYVTGEVYKTPKGIALTARLGDSPAQTFEGARTEVDSLEQQAAEAVYRFSQPYRYAVYLEQHGRVDEAIEVISNLAANGPASERGWAYGQWAQFEVNDFADTDTARRLAKQGFGYTDGATVRADITLIGLEVWAGHDEAALRYSEDLDPRAQKRTDETTRAYFEQNMLVSAGWLADLHGDFNRSARQWLKVARLPEFQGLARLSYGLAASTYARNHDLKASQQALEPLGAPADTSFLLADAENAFMALPGYWTAAERQDWPGALADAREADAWLESHQAKLRVMSLLRAVWIRPLEALALARTGDTPGAERLIESTPRDCILCLRVRGQVAAHKGEWPAAERWFAEAARLAPSLPYAFTDWGRARLEHGDADGALVVLKQAHRLSPAFADPEELMGEAFMRKSDWSNASEEFQEADEDAPRWGRNHLKWGESLLRSGHKHEGERELAVARDLFLTGADRAELLALPK